MKFLTTLYILLSMSVVFTAITSCTKTELVPLEEKTSNRILEYKVTNDAQPLSGAIDDVNSTITLYIPYYSGIDVIVPEIKIETGAILVDADKKEINLDGGIEPVPVDTIGYKYHVLGSDDIIRNYTLIIKTQAYPEALIAGYSFNASTSQINTTSPLEVVAGGRVNILGNFESTSRDLRFEATHRSTGKVRSDLLALNTLTINHSNAYYQAQLRTNIEADSGLYDIKFMHKGRTTTLPPLRLTYKKPGFYDAAESSLTAWTKKTGDQVVLKVRSNQAFDNSLNGTIIGLKRVYMIIRKQTPGGPTTVPADFPESLFDTPIELEIISYDRAEVKLRVPNLPAGKYEGNSSVSGIVVNHASFALYFDYEDATGWGKNNLSAVPFFMQIL
ncbi:hypothetical protein [Sphingobacterium tabacisoli]|uniref:DUF1735 domain-containing protein n=1 Tax=Sphingobacterium tabacisoli TaxID=2044855 RepID=A0ABW5L6T8_9SPHI|nr:hypothetical protein [Sphingobacterium tabacisoli]